MGVSRGESFETGEDIAGRTVAQRGATAGDEETTRTEDSLEPDAGGEAAEHAEAGGEGERREGEDGRTVRWEDLPPWARREIQDGRTNSRRFKAFKEQIEAMGGQVDEETGQIIMPEPATTPAATRQAPATEQVARSGLPPERKAHYLSQLRMASLAEDPDAARLEVMLDMADEIASSRAQSESARALTTALTANERSTIAGYKEAFRSNAETGAFFKAVERDFDGLVAQTKEEYRKLGIPFIPNDQIMEYLRDLAIGRGTSRIVRGLATGDRGRVADEVAGQTRLAPGSTTRTREMTPTQLSDADRSIVRRMARGAGIDEAVLEKRLTRGGS